MPPLLREGRNENGMPPTKAYEIWVAGIMWRRDQHLISRIHQAGEHEGHRAGCALGHQHPVRSHRFSKTRLEIRGDRFSQRPETSAVRVASLIPGQGFPAGKACRRGAGRIPVHPAPNEQYRFPRAQVLRPARALPSPRKARLPHFWRSRGRDWLNSGQTCPPVSPAADRSQAEQTCKCLELKPFWAYPPLTPDSPGAIVGRNQAPVRFRIRLLARLRPTPFDFSFR